MFFTVRLKTIGIAVGALVLCVCIALGTWAVAASGGDIAIPNGITIVLDAGHGGRDAGVTGPAGARESDINLAVARAAETFLRQKGYNVVMTRRSSDGLYNPDSPNKKQADMQRRRQIIEEARPDLVVSIHQNSFPGASSVRGPRVFHAANSTDGRTAAAHIQNSMNSALGSNAPAAVGNYFILTATAFTSVLIECGFLTNAEEERLLNSAEYQQRMGYIIFFAIHTLLSDAAVG